MQELVRRTIVTFAALAVFAACTARAQEEDEIFSDVDAADTSPKDSTPAEDDETFTGGDLEAPEEDFPTMEGDSWATAAPDRLRLGIRGGVLLPESDFAAGPMAGFYLHKLMGRLGVELELAVAQLSSDDASISSRLVMGNAAATVSLMPDSNHQVYLHAGIGALSESARSSGASDNSMLSAVAIGVGLNSYQSIDLRLGLAMLPNSDNVGSLTQLTLGIIY